MFKAKRIKSDIKPLKFESLNNGIWYYNYDITESIVLLTIMDTVKEFIEYEFLLVRISGSPTVSKCIEAILKLYINEDKSNLYDLMLLQGTNNQIDDICFNIKVDFGIENPISKLDLAKKEVIRKIDEYDTSDKVNSFILNGIKVWLDKDTRVGLMNSLTIEKNSGKEKSTLWFNNMSITINCDAAIQMLSALELYALNCYNVTAEHKVNIENCNSLEEVSNYDYTTGYPELLSFNI